MSVPTISQALLQAKTLGLDPLDAQLLLLHTIGRPPHSRAWLVSHNHDLLSATDQAEFKSLVRRRATGEPLAYVTGHKEFFGLDLTVDARVMIPRPDTETLVEWALDTLAKSPLPVEQLDVLDLGTGSGAIALALKATQPALRVSAIDRSEQALVLARENSMRLQLDVSFHQGSWLDGTAQCYHLIVSNPPYIAAQDQHLVALGHEPRQALVSGTDGLDDIRRIISQAPAHLQPGSWLLLEHGYDQAAEVRNLLQQADFVDVQSRPDLGGIERCSGGRIP